MISKLCGKVSNHDHNGSYQIDHIIWELNTQCLIRFVNCNFLVIGQE